MIKNRGRTTRLGANNNSPGYKWYKLTSIPMENEEDGQRDGQGRVNKRVLLE